MFSIPWILKKKFESVETILFIYFIYLLKNYLGYLNIPLHFANMKKDC